MSTTTERPPFELHVSGRDGRKIFHLKGRLMDQQQADQLMAALDEHLAGDAKVDVVIDMSELQYMNSTGLNIMISVLGRSRKNGGEVVMAGLTSGVRQLFTVTKLDSVFRIADNVDAALAQLGS